MSATAGSLVSDGWCTIAGGVTGQWSLKQASKCLAIADSGLGKHLRADHAAVRRVLHFTTRGGHASAGMDMDTTQGNAPLCLSINRHYR